MRRTSPNRLTEFLNGKGFYIVLILCIAAIGISGYILFFAGNTPELDEELLMPDGGYTLYNPTGAGAEDAEEETILTDIPDYAVRDSEVVMADDYVESVSGSGDTSTVQDDEIEPPATAAPTDEDDAGKIVGQAEAVSGTAEIPVSPSDTPSSSDDSGESTEVVAPFFVWPVSGEVLNSFSTDELVFNSTTEDWRIHTGIDIAAPSGTHVAAVGDGVVEDVYQDEMMGWTVVVNHGDGLRSVSRGLMEDIPVSIGDTVRAGETIGGVGNTASLESEMPSHLHLEMIGDGAQIDPLEVLP